MSQNRLRQGDALDDLDVDDTELSYKEKSMIDMLYPMAVEKKTASSPPSSSSSSPSASSAPPSSPPTERHAANAVHIVNDGVKVWSHFKDIVIATVLFVVLNLPIADRFIAKLVKVDDANYRLAAKAILFALLLFLVHNFYLSRSRK